MLTFKSQAELNLVYSASEMNRLSPAIPTKVETSEEELKEIKEKLYLLDKTISSFDIEETSISGYYKIQRGDQKYYVHKDVDHLFIGDAVKFLDGSPIILGEVNSTKEKRLFVQSLNENEAIIFKAEKEKDRLYVFTDITCPFCKRLHKDIKKINEKGITLVYLPYPRSGLNTKLERALNNIWCIKTKKEYHKAITSGNKYIESQMSGGCNNDQFTKYYYHEANRLEIKGTPFILNKMGEVIGGYEGFNNFIRKVVKTW